MLGQHEQWESNSEEVENNASFVACGKYGGHQDGFKGNQSTRESLKGNSSEVNMTLAGLKREEQNSTTPVEEEQRGQSEPRLSYLWFESKLKKKRFSVDVAHVSNL